MSETEELRNCPFCGSSEADAFLTEDTAWVSCGECDGSGAVCDTEADAIAAWNRRAEPEVLDFPDQPLIRDDHGAVRFKQNPIVRWLLDAGPFDMNQIAATQFPRWARSQFAQLIGYSIGGYSELSYVSDEEYERNARRQPTNEGET